MHPETVEKINFLTQNEFFKLNLLISENQLEEKYNGSIPNLTNYWL